MLPENRQVVNVCSTQVAFQILRDSLLTVITVNTQTSSQPFG
jgi:hypothetical protein